MRLIYQDLDDLKKALQAVNPAIAQFETSCFDGNYITGDITAEYLTGIEDARNKPCGQGLAMTTTKVSSI